MKNAIVIFVCLLMIATVFGATFSVIGAKGGNGGGGGKSPKDPPPPAVPEIAYVNGNALMVMNVDGARQTMIYEGTVMGPNWSPNGESITFLGDYTTGVSRELWTINVSIVNDEPVGSNPTLLNDNAYYNPAWSPDGDVIAFPKRIYDEVAGNDAPLLLVTILPTGGSTTTIYTAEGGHRVSFPTWSGDASRIAWAEKDTVADTNSIKVMDLSTSDVTTVYGPVSGPISSLDWARTSDTIAYMGLLNGNTAVFTIDINQSDPAPQLIEGGEVRSSSWSPNDTQIVYDKPNKLTGGGRISGWSVFMEDLSTGETIKLVRGNRPDWLRA
jgi:Tol biopolymer transport system component